MITDPLFYALAAPALLATGISKGGFGSGVGILAVPLMSLVVSPVVAAAVTLPILCFMDVFGLWHYRGRWDPVNLRIMVPGAVLGLGLGAAGFSALDRHWLGLIIGVIAVTFTLARWLSVGQGAAPARPSFVRGSFWATTSGFTSFVSHAGGPPINFYLLPQRMDKTLFVGTTVVFFAGINYAKIVPYAWLGLFTPGNLWTALALSPVAPIGMLLGIWLHDRIPPVPFYRICYLFVFIAGLKLLYDHGGLIVGMLL